MAQGSIKKRSLEGGRVRWDVTVDLGPDPLTRQRRQRKKAFRSRREAQAGLAAWRAAIEGGTAVDRSAQTLGDVMAFWLQTHRPNVRPNTYAGYEDTVRRHILPALGAVRVQQLTPAMLQAFYNDKVATGCGARTLGLCHIHIAQALTLAARQGLVARNVADAVTPPREAHREMATWDADQARQFLSVAQRSNHGPLWTVALATGMRRGEVLGLRWKDVDVERGVLRVCQTVGVLRGKLAIKAPKTRSSRRAIRVPAEVLELLREHRRRQNERRLAVGPAWHHHDLVFTVGHGGPIHPDNLKRDYDRLVQLAGVPRIRIHDLRHTRISLAIQEGAPIKLVSEEAGHARTSITMDVYAHVMPPQRSEIADRLGALLFAPRAREAPRL